MEGGPTEESAWVVVRVLAVNWPDTTVQLSQGPVGCVQSLPLTGLKLMANWPSLTAPSTSSNPTEAPHARLVSVLNWNGVRHPAVCPAGMVGKLATGMVTRTPTVLVARSKQLRMARPLIRRLTSETYKRLHSLGSTVWLPLPSASR